MENSVYESVPQETMEELKALAMEKMQSYSGCHDHFHIMRVLNNAQLIMDNIREKVDKSIVDAVVLLHDVGDRKLIGASEDDYTIAEGIMESVNIEASVRAQVMENIQRLGFASDNGEMETMEGKIAQDADRLDALGAVGIARAFAHSGTKGFPLWDPERKIQVFASKEAYRKSTGGNALNHFYEKLFLLKDMMHTDAAKNIAEGRHQYMMEYAERFKKEFFGEL